MWNVIASNRLTQKRNRQQQYFKHRKTLSCIKSQIDNVMPQQFDFLVTKPKPKQQAFQKNMVVQAENQDLVRRMIRPRSSSSKKKKMSRNSLHSTYFKHVAERIEHDNAKLVTRLHGATACLNFNQLQQDHQRTLKWKQAHKKAPGTNIVRPLSAI